MGSVIRRSNTACQDLAIKPRLVQLMLTARCPLSCPHCLAVGPSGEELTVRSLANIVEQVAALGVDELLFTGGEPCSREELPEIIGVLEANGVRWSINTALLPGPEARRAMERYPPCFAAVSLDGPPDVHDAFRGRAGAALDALRSIAFFGDLGAPVAAGTTVTSHNFDHLPRTFGLVLESAATEWGLHLVVPEGRAASRRDLSLSTRQLRQLLRFAAARRNSFPVTMADEIGYCGSWEPLVRDGPFACGAGRAQCVILPDGELVPCTTMDRATSAGNLRRTSLAELWERGFGELRSYTPQGKCAGCRDAELCGQGCWLQRRHGEQCFRRAWRMPGAVRAAGFAVSLGLATYCPTDAAARPMAPPITQMEVLQRQIISWYSSQAQASRATSAAEIKRQLPPHLATDPGVTYFIFFVSGKRPRSIAAIQTDITRAVTTRQRSLCLAGLFWRDLTEWSLRGTHPARRSAAETQQLQQVYTLVSKTAEAWRREIFRAKLDPFLRDPSSYRWFFRSKAGPPPWMRPQMLLASKRGWSRPDLTAQTLARHPYGETMQLSLKGTGLKVMRQGRTLPFDGKLGPFDLLVVPAQGSPSVKASTPALKLAITLPAGTTLSHGDLLRLGHEQNAAALGQLAQRRQLPTSPWALPALWASLQTLQSSTLPEDRHQAATIRWLLADLFLF